MSNDISSLFGKVWGLVFNCEQNFLNFIKTFCYPIEKNLIDVASNLNQRIELNLIEPILNLCKSMKDFCPINGLLWQIHTKQQHIDTSKIDLYYNLIKNEREQINSIINQDFLTNDIKIICKNCFDIAIKELNEFESLIKDIKN